MAMVAASLKGEGASEASRIAAARAWARAGDQGALAQLEGDRPWAAIARGCTLRRRLGHRAVFLWRIALEDASGVIVESHLVAVVGALDRTTSARRKRSLTAVVRALQVRIQVELADAITLWERTARESIGAFSRAHADRRRAVAAHQAAMPRRESQPGLFDRRTERAWSAAAEHSVEAGADTAESIDTARSRSTVSPRPPQLLLVLVP